MPVRPAWRPPPARRSLRSSPTSTSRTASYAVRAAKEAINGIDPQRVHQSYRFEQGFTFELNLAGVADEHRDAFVDKRHTDTST